ncbi:MAG TPA: DUF177 domain-containing protein [Chloroflexota bacterium]|jgi:uncharacterized protein|nr:DUF177 domain-containing protein [Chloroflexota bacterium]
MRWNVAGLLKDDVGAIRLYEFSEPPYEIDRGVEATEPVSGEVKLTRTNRGILTDARIMTRVRQQCSRCLDELSTPISARFSEEYFPTVDLRTGQPLARPEGEDGFMLSEAHELDITEPVRQAVLLAQPMQPLCRPDCRGLCPHCGQNLNQGQCTWAPEPADPRLAKLADWLKTHASTDAPPGPRQRRRAGR